MNDREFSVKKNLLELKHSVYGTKASTYLGLAFGSWTAVFLALREIDIPIALIIATSVSTIFFLKAKQYFRGCKKVQDDLKRLIERKSFIKD